MHFTRIATLFFCTLILVQTTLAAETGKQQVRFATFNIAMGLEAEGELYDRLISGEDER